MRGICARRTTNLNGLNRVIMTTAIAKLASVCPWQRQMTTKSSRQRASWKARPNAQMTGAMRRCAAIRSTHSPASCTRSPDRNNGIVPVVGVDGWSRIINDNPQFDGMVQTG